MRRPLSLLLMLFLLLTQQATLSHAVGHLAPAAIAAAAQEASSGSTEFADHDCALCIAAAQYAATLPASVQTLAPVAASASIPSSAFSHPFEAAPALAFHSRAPPRV